eukprot:COSAG01_NODE_27432_length_685_cov_18.373720_1_plen_91_part_00
MQVRPIEPLLRRHDQRLGVVLGTEPFDHAQNQNQRNMLVCNAFMVSTARHPFWHAVFRALIEKAEWLKSCRESNRCPFHLLFQDQNRRSD